MAPQRKKGLNFGEDLIRTAVFSWRFPADGVLSPHTLFGLKILKMIWSDLGLADDGRDLTVKLESNRAPAARRHRILVEFNGAQFRSIDRYVLCDVGNLVTSDGPSEGGIELVHELEAAGSRGSARVLSCAVSKADDDPGEDHLMQTAACSDCVVRWVVSTALEHDAIVRRVEWCRLYLDQGVSHGRA